MHSQQEAYMPSLLAASEILGFFLWGNGWYFWWEGVMAPTLSWHPPTGLLLSPIGPPVGGFSFLCRLAVGGASQDKVSRRSSVDPETWSAGVVGGAESSSAVRQESGSALSDSDVGAASCSESNVPEEDKGRLGCGDTEDTLSTAMLTGLASQLQSDCQSDGPPHD